MGREVDVRNFNVNRVTPERVTKLRGLASAATQQGMHKVEIAEFDAITGNPSRIRSINAPAIRGNFTNRALDHLRALSPALGFEAAVQSAEFLADPQELTTSAGAVTVHTQQLYRSLPIYGAAVSVRFAPNGAIDDTAGAPVTLTQAQPMTPAIAVTDAVKKAAEFLASASLAGAHDHWGQPLPAASIDVAHFTPKVRASFANRPERLTTLDPGPFGAEIKANLIWFPLGDRLALAWEVLLTLADGMGQYDLFVDASDGKILRSALTTRSIAAVGLVYQVDGGAARQLTPMPQPVTQYGVRHPSLGQENWRWCRKCQGLHFNGHATHGVCPAGGAHEATGSGNYRLVDSSPAAPGQREWRWCQRCEGLYFNGGGSFGVCPAGGAHVNAGSGNYTLTHESPLAIGQDGWRWCKKCQLLFFAPRGIAGICPAGGAHDGSESGNYTLSHNAPALPAGFPDAWVTATNTVGNHANAHLGSAGAALTGVNVGGVVRFEPADAFGDAQKILNIFYYNGVIHDLMYVLGFREGDGNFQQDNLGRGGSASDRVDARAHSGAVWGTANMDTPVDGSAPTMNMGLVTSTNRHTAFDSTVVFHEFMHGVTNRLVGGPMNVHALDAIQSGGMGEGWGDYVACTVNNVTILGDWILNNTGGIRAFPYDANFPDGFGAIGTGRYDEVHNIGEIWAATLMEMNRRTDRNLVMQLVIDALKLAPANPSFLHMRDALYKALDNLRDAGQLTPTQRDAAWQGMASTFARFGMGRGASSTGSGLTGIVADPRVGQDLWRWCQKCESLHFGGHATHGVCAAGGAHDGTRSGNYDIIHNWASAPGQEGWRWCQKCEAMWFSGHPTQGVCPAGGTHTASGSGSYKLLNNAPGAWGQNRWRWCRKCENLYFSGHRTQGVCAAGGNHDGSGSGDYVLMSR